MHAVSLTLSKLPASLKSFRHRRLRGEESGEGPCRFPTCFGLHPESCFSFVRNRGYQYEWLKSLQSTLANAGHCGFHPVRMEVVASTEGLNLQYAVIGRLKQGHDACGLAPYQIRGVIAFELNGFIDEMDIIHVPPNFILCTNNPHAQAALLKKLVLKTNSFQLELLPWCKEHELAQLPWITDVPAKISEIFIDPLQILPVIRKGATNGYNLRSECLKNTLASKIPKSYDLHAPDLSYLLIVELREYYDSKAAIFQESKQLVSTVLNTTQEFYEFAATNIDNMSSCVKTSHGIVDVNTLHGHYDFINGLRTALSSVQISLFELTALASKILQQTESPLNLQGFTAGPPTTEIPAPATYADRLKQIYIAVMDRLHRVTPIIETVKREENRYETYITVDGFTTRYYGRHHKSASTMEAAAIYYRLKHITNGQSYRIIDLNFPTLAELVRHLNRWNARINQMQQFMSESLETMQIVQHNFIDGCSSAKRCEFQIQGFQYLSDIATKLQDKAESSYGTATNFYEMFNTYKAQYQAVHIEMYSPTRSWYPWSWTVRPLEH